MAKHAQVSMVISRGYLIISPNGHLAYQNQSDSRLYGWSNTCAQAFEDIKAYYRDITTANLERIMMLKV